MFSNTSCAGMSLFCPFVQLVCNIESGKAVFEVGGWCGDLGIGQDSIVVFSTAYDRWEKCKTVTAAIQHNIVILALKRKRAGDPGATRSFY